MNGGSGARSCSQCGNSVTGNFCGACGTAVAASGSPGGQGWTSIAAETVLNANPHSFTRTALAMARAPIGTATRLANDPSYRSHWLFLAASLGFYFTVIEVLVPRIVGRFRNETVDIDKWDFVTFQAITVVALLILAPVLYYTCRALSDQRQPPRAYVKLAALGFGYWYVLLTLLTLVVMAVGMVVALVLLQFGNPAALDPLTSVLQVCQAVIYQGSVAIVFALLHRRFWALRWWVTVLLTIGYILVSQWIVFPLVSEFADRIDLTEWLRQLFG